MIIESSKVIKLRTIANVVKTAFEFAIVARYAVVRLCALEVSETSSGVNHFICLVAPELHFCTVVGETMLQFPDTVALIPGFGKRTFETVVCNT